MAISTRVKASRMNKAVEFTESEWETTLREFVTTDKTAKQLTTSEKKLDFLAKEFLPLDGGKSPTEIKSFYARM